MSDATMGRGAPPSLEPSRAESWGAAYSAAAGTALAEESIVSEKPQAASPGHLHASGDETHRCMTQEIATFLLGRVTMDEVCQYCVLEVLAHLHPWQMSVYEVGSDSLFRLVGAFGRGPGQGSLHEYSCLDDPHIGEMLRGGRPLANFPLSDMSAHQQLRIFDLDDGPQVLWPLSMSRSLVGALQVRFKRVPRQQDVEEAMSEIAAPIALVLDMGHAFEGAAVAPTVGTRNVIGLTSRGTPNGRRPYLALADGLDEASTWRPQAHPSPDGRIVAHPSLNGRAALPQQALTPRQIRVLGLMAKGMTNGQIARVLAFSESTVRQETMAIYRVLQVKGRVEAVEVARERHLLEPDTTA